MSQISAFVGSDVSKLWLDVFVRPLGKHERFANSAKGIAAMAAWLRRLDVAIAWIGLEASGGYERDAAQALSAAGLPVTLLDPLRIRRFAQAGGTRAKNDRIDARVIADYLVAFSDKLRLLAFDPHRSALAELCRQREALVETKVMLQNRAEHHRHPLVRRMDARLLRNLEADIGALDAEIRGLLAGVPGLAALEELLRSVPGIGAVAAATLIAELPELGQLPGGKIAALAGVAPFDRDSGAISAPRHIAGGRAAIRRVLYMAALVGAARGCNKPLAAFYRRLTQAGKPPKLVLTACMRKLVELLNTIAARGYPWKPVLAEQ